MIGMPGLDWKPIETAPKGDWPDAVHLIVFDPALVDSWRRDLGIIIGWWESKHDCWMTDANCDGTAKPTHWLMRLPDAPAVTV